MKLKKFNLITLPKQIGGGHNKTSRVSFGKAGTIHFNSSACTLMEIKEESKMSLSQDEEEPDNWYFFVDQAEGYPLRLGYDKKGRLFNHAILVKEVAKHFALAEDATHNFLIAGQPTMIKGDKTKYWGIIKPVEV